MATVDIKNAVKAGMLEALAEQEAAKAHQSLVDFHEEHNSAPKADPMAAVIENQASIIELFKQFNERTSGIGNAATAQENYGQSGFAQQAMASSQNSMSLGSNFTGDMVAGNGSIKNIIVNHGIVFTDSSGAVQGGISNIGAAQTASPVAGSAAENNENISYKAGLAGDETDRVQAKIDHEESKAYQEYTMKPTMTKLSQALDKYLNQENQPLTVSDESGFGLSSFLGTLIGGAIGALGGLAIGWMQGLKAQWSKVGKAFSSVWKGATKWLKDSKLGKSLANLGTKFKSLVGGMKDTVVGKFKSMTAGVRETLGSLKSSFMKTLTSWKDAFKNSAVGKAASAVKDKIGGLFSKAKSLIGTAKNAAQEGKLLSFVGAKLSKVGKAAATAYAKSPVGKFSKAAISAAKSAGSVAAKVGRKLPVISGVFSLADGVKNTYDVWKKGGSISDISSTALAGATDALMNTLAVPEIIGTVKGAVNGAMKDGFKGALKGAGSGFMNAHDENEVSIGQAFSAEIAHLAGNETETTKAIRRANMYGLTKDQVGLVNINGNAGGFATAAALYQGDKKLAAGSTANSNTPTATTGENANGKRANESEKNKEMVEGMKEAFIEAMTSEEVKTANAEQAKATGEAINGSLMG